MFLNNMKTFFSINKMCFKNREFSVKFPINHINLGTYPLFPIHFKVYQFQVKNSSKEARSSKYFNA